MVLTCWEKRFEKNLNNLPNPRHKRVIQGSNLISVYRPDDGSGSKPVNLGLMDRKMLVGNIFFRTCKARARATQKIR